MEDTHLVSLKLPGDVSFFGVFDGHGGQEVAKFVELHFIEELKKLESFIKKDYHSALTECYLKMDELLRAEGDNIGKLSKDPLNYTNDGIVGCTATSVLITKDQIFCANAGDARTVLCTKGEARPLSFDHKPIHENELARIKKAGGMVRFGRVFGILAVARAIGDLGFKDNPSLSPADQAITCVPDITVTERSEADQFIIMACDGLWECRENQEAVD